MRHMRDPRELIRSIACIAQVCDIYATVASDLFHLEQTAQDHLAAARG